MLLQAAQKRARVSCSPLLSVAGLQKAFASSLESVQHDLPVFLQSYEKLTFKTSATAVLPQWKQHEAFWAGLLEVLPDAMLPTVKGRAALEACHGQQALASDKYLASTPLTVLLDRTMSCCRVQLSKFRELAMDGTSYASVSRRCTVEELAALNRLLALTTRNLSNRSNQTDTQQAPTAECQALADLVVEPEEALPAVQSLVLLEPQAPRQSSSSSSSASRSFKRFVCVDELFGGGQARQETSKESETRKKSFVSRKDRQALESALLVVPASSSEKQLLKKQKKATAKAVAKVAAAQAKTAAKAKAKTPAKAKAKAQAGKSPSTVPKSEKKKAKASPKTLKAKQEKQRLRKNFASRRYHEVGQLFLERFLHILAHSIAGEEGRDCSGKVRGAELHLGPCGPPKGFAGVGQEPLDRPLKEAASNQKFLVLAPAAGERIFFRVCCSANIARRFDVPLIRIDSPSSLVRKLFARCARRKNSDLQLFSLHSVALESRCFICLLAALLFK